jgi:adenosine deaminase
MRPIPSLPKANLHLHLTGAMRPATLADLADQHGLPLPGPLPYGTQYGWATFQERYDAARSVVRTSEDVERVVREAIMDNAADGADWIEIQVDPTSYAERLGSEAAVVETILSAANGRAAVILASSWARAPAVAERIARLAVSYADSGVIGFGLSNDERRGWIADFAPAGRIAMDGGLRVVPHSGFYEAAWHVRACVEQLGAHRIGHGLTAAADPATMDLLAERGVALEVCPASYPPLGVARLAELPVRALLEAGVQIALGTDDPLLFGADLSRQYGLLREHLELTDTELAAIARHSVHASAAPTPTRTAMLAGVDAWLAA